VLRAIGLGAPRAVCSGFAARLPAVPTSSSTSLFANAPDSRLLFSEEDDDLLLDASSSCAAPPPPPQPAPIQLSHTLSSSGGGSWTSEVEMGLFSGLPLPPPATAATLLPLPVASVPPPAPLPAWLSPLAALDDTDFCLGTD
jgi:hypothetical protein